MHREIGSCLHVPSFVITLGPHTFYICWRLLSPHIQHQRQTPTCSLPDQGHFHPAHPQSTKSLPALIYDKHTYFCNLSGAPDPCIMLKRKLSCVQHKLCSTPAITPTHPSPSACPTVWLPTRVDTSSLGKVSAPCTSSLLLSQQSFAARFLEVPAMWLATPVPSSYTRRPLSHLL